MSQNRNLRHTENIEKSVKVINQYANQKFILNQNVVWSFIFITKRTNGNIILFSEVLWH